MKATVLAMAAAGGFMFLAMDYALAIPDVHVSYETRECVEVVNYGGIVFGKTEYSCEMRPTRFNHVWVK